MSNREMKFVKQENEDLCISSFYSELFQLFDDPSENSLLDYFLEESVDSVKFSPQTLRNSTLLFSQNNHTSKFLIQRNENVSEKLFTPCFDPKDFRSITEDFDLYTDSKANTMVNENKINQLRLDELEGNSTRYFLNLIYEEDFEYGLENRIDVFLREKMLTNSCATKEWLNSIFIRNFDDTKILISILRAISRMNFDEISPQGPTMVIAGLSHDNLQVQECSVRVLENWENSESLRILENVKVRQSWLQDYIDDVVNDLREVIYVSCCQKD